MAVYAYKNASNFKLRKPRCFYKNSIRFSEERCCRVLWYVFPFPVCNSENVGTLNSYSMLKLRFLINTHFCSVLQKCLPSVLCNYSGHQTTYFIVELPQNRGGLMLIFFYFPQLLLLRSLFPSKGKLKYIIIHFPYEICNDIIWC